MTKRHKAIIDSKKNPSKLLPSEILDFSENLREILSTIDYRLMSTTEADCSETSYSILKHCNSEIS